MIQLIKGFKDILPEEITLWQQVETLARTIFEDFGYREIRLPILEKAELFARSIGDTTDIVEKEMYAFEDGKRGLVTLRPEATASVVRSYIQQRLYANDPIQKLYTIGPMFRKERPQKGRYRQFYQIDAEVFGIESPLMDAQMIFMLMTLFSRLNVSDITVLINSLGCPACRPRFKESLLSMLGSKKELLCENCNRRLSKNPLRVLDCKVPSCRDAVKDAPSISDFLCNGCESHFSEVKKTLKHLGVKYEIDKSLVRGLDYYTRTIFEIQTTALGAQNAVAGGGRYDGLVEALDGPSQPAIGFAIGFDRLCEILSQNSPISVKPVDVFFIATGDESKKVSFESICKLNVQGITADMDYGDRSLKSLMKRADKLNASFVVIADDEALKSGNVTLRNMNTKDQISIPAAGIAENIKSRIIR
ncbi:MAG: histidine--tRNA ligase [Proteobacteria bacterium]|nr:histidine--tRNA ligase [Pseudomonadota bacterium]